MLLRAGGLHNNGLTQFRAERPSVNGRGLRTQKSRQQHKNATLGDFTPRTEMLHPSFRTARTVYIRCPAITG